MTIFSPEELSRLPKSRIEAKQLNLKFYYTGKPCKYGHVHVRYSSGDCITCNEIHGKKHREENKEDLQEYSRQYREDNAEVIANNNREYAKNNRDKINAYAANRRALKLAQTPPNVNKELILDFHTRAKELNDVYGTKMEVDHIIPLDAGGLHHEDNLQLLPKKLNASKGAKTDWVHPNNIDEQPLTHEMIQWLDTFR